MITIIVITFLTYINYYITICYMNRGCGGIGRRYGLKIRWFLKSWGFKSLFPQPKPNINSLGSVPERLKGTDCKSVGKAFTGSNPVRPIYYIKKNGKVAERFIAPVLKTDLVKANGGSNPSLSERVLKY